MNRIVYYRGPEGEHGQLSIEETVDGHLVSPEMGGVECVQWDNLTQALKFIREFLEIHVGEPLNMFVGGE
jgi:hypothetical protein